MFYEVIYTRCRKGINIKTGKEISNDGFKVFSCSKELLSGEVVDTAFLSNEIQRVQSYSDPGFMDDAYLYYTPPMGDSILVNFHPIKFNPTQEGDFSKRPGNIINQALVGDFTDVYPFETFREKKIWHAQERGEAFYYMNAPIPLEPKERLDSLSGTYALKDIKAFVQDGRQEAVKKAVAFLIKQYADVPKREYLVILDDNAANIELWIAAIEYAFSPRIAANISFATRMDNFVNRNKIKQGEISQGANEGTLNEIKSKLRAMIIGVISSDRPNASLTKSARTYGFALLDGTQKKAMFDADTSNEYFDFITAYDDAHTVFCREFLQMFKIDAPSSSLLELYRSYTLLSDEGITPSNFNKAFLPLENIPVQYTEASQRLYKQANSMIRKCWKANFFEAISLRNWILKTAIVMKDESAESRIFEETQTL